MARLIYLTQEQFDCLQTIHMFTGEECILVAPSMAEEVRSQAVEPNRAAALYDCDLDLLDIKAELVARRNHSFMSFLRSEVPAE